MPTSAHMDGDAVGEPEKGAQHPPAAKKHRRQLLIALAFLLPNLIGFLAFTLGPVISSLALSFFRWDILRAPRFADLDNYIAILGSSDFWTYLLNTLVFMLAIPLGMAVGLALAVALHGQLRGRLFFRTAFFVPVVCPTVASAMIWAWLYDRDFGLINQLLGAVGVPRLIQALGLDGLLGLSVPFDWLGNPVLAKPALILMMVWSGAGYKMLLYLAALSGIPEHYYDAARIDGAGRWQQFRHITWPMLAPTNLFIAVIGAIGAFQVFESIYIMTGGGPGKATTTLAFEVYSKGFTEFQMGYASSYAWILCLLVFGITMVQWKYAQRRAHFGALQ
jgi:multiple sugar transport system permease protein